MNEVNARRARLVLGWVTVFRRYDTIRYDTRCYFNVRSKANMSQLNLPHGYTISVCNKPTRSTQPCIPSGSLDRVPASAGVRVGLSHLSGGR